MRKKLQEAIMSTPDLPSGFTELEYLECSGTQYIRPGLVAQGLNILAENIVTANKRTFVLGMETNRNPQDQLFVDTSVNNKGTGIGVSVCLSGGTRMGAGFYDRQPESRWVAELNWLDGYIACSSNGSTNKTNIDFSTGFNVKTAEVTLFARNMTIKPGEALGTWRDYRYIGKCCYLKAWYERDVLFRDFVPVLDADGIPCMYDKVSKQCFRNLGTGTFGYKIKATGETVAPVSG